MGSILSGLRDAEGNVLCNFRPQLEALENYYSSDGAVPVLYAKIFLALEDDFQSESVLIPVRQLGRTDWLNFDPRCRFDPKFPATTVTRYIVDAIKKQIAAVPQEAIERVFSLSQVGLHILQGEPCFCTGHEVIRPSSKIEENSVRVEVKSTRKEMAYAPSLAEHEAVSRVFNLISLCPDPGRIILAETLVSVMRQAYIDAGKAPQLCVFLHGPTGTQKTTMAAFLTQMYNRDKGVISPSRLNASIPAAVRLLQESQDEVVILDDLCPAESNHVRGQQEETLIEVCRFVGDGTLPARMRGKVLSNEAPKCCALFTGEYLVGEGSDAARLLPVEMQQPDGVKLREFQVRPLDISTFYRFYIKWFVNNYDEVVQLLRT